MVIYIVKNSVNGKIYIGKFQGTDPLKRWRSHIRSAFNGSNLYFHKAIRKYGESNFAVALLSSHADSVMDLNQQEIFFIEKYRSNQREFGYNMTSGGDGASWPGTTNPMFGKAGFGGKKHSEETKYLQSKANSGVPKSGSHRSKLSASIKTMYESPQGLILKEVLRRQTSERFKGKAKPESYSLRMKSYNLTRVNPIVGRVWATSPQGVSKLVNPHEIAEGWTKGRKNATSI